MNELIFNGKNFTEFNAYYATSNFLDGAAKDVQSVSVVGRSGDLQLSNNRYKNLSLKIRVYVTRDMEQSMRAMRNYLESVHGYARVEISDQPNEYRMAAYKEMFAPDSYDSKVGVVDLTFDSMPQRFLKSGETTTSVSSSSSDVTGNPVTIDNPSGLTTITDLQTSFSPKQDLNGYDHPWVGGSGKNLFKLTREAGESETKAGVVYTVNSDGSISAVGTSTANNSYWSIGNVLLEAGDYILNGCPSGGSSTTYFIAIRKTAYNGTLIGRDTGEGFEFTLTENTQVYVTLYCQSGVEADFSFYPMVRLATETDATYEPYENICPIEGWTEQTVKRTGKNLLQNTATTRTVNGVTFTVAEDGTITATGTATANADCVLASVAQLNEALEANTEYILTGCPSGGSNNTYLIYTQADGTTFRDVGNGVSISQVNGFTGALRIRIYNGQTVNNLVFKPMIRLAPETDATYEPYRGNTYTIDLNGTRYGGYVDLVSGVLTLTHKQVILNGSESWAYVKLNGLDTFNRTAADGVVPARGTGGYEGWCDSFPVGTGVGSITGIKDNYLYISLYALTGTRSSLLIVKNGITSADDFKTWLSNNNVNVVYPMQTPQTVQLTAQQISLLTGTNVISTDGDTVTVTITEPSVLENPTLFESKPLIRLYGSGTLNINDQYITVTEHPFPYIDIDCELMDAFYQSSNANQYVSFSTDDYVTLQSGSNYFAYSGFTKVDVTPRWWEV